MPGPLDALKNATSLSVGPSPFKEKLQRGFEAGMGAISGLLGVGPETPSNLVGQLAGAALPLLPSLKGVGTALRGLESLPMDEASRMRRAVEQGYTLPAYHGTPSNFREFNPAIRGGQDFGIHVATDPQTAANIHMAPAYSPTGFNVMPLQVRAQNPLDLPDVGRWQSPLNWDDLVESGDIPLDLQDDLPRIIEDYVGRWNRGGGNESVNLQFQQDMKDLLQKRGYDSIRYPNFTEGKGEPSYLLLDPRQVKSRFAAFDPSKFGKTSDILASTLLPLLGLQSLDVSEER